MPWAIASRRGSAYCMVAGLGTLRALSRGRAWYLRSYGGRGRWIRLFTPEWTGSKMGNLRQSKSV